MSGKGLALVFVLVLIAGIAGGLVFAWVLAPVEYVDTAPDSLRVQDQLVYLTILGDLYVPLKDLAWAEARLEELGVEADGDILASYVELYLDGGGRPEHVRHLAQLAKDLGASGGVLQVFGSQPTPVAEATALPDPVASDSLFPQETATPLPSVTPSPIFRLVEQTALCAPPGEPGRILIWVRDSQGDDLAGMQIAVTWAMGQDRLFTGLKPDKGAGFADFEMRPNTQYDVALADFQGDVAKGLFPDLSQGVCPTETIAIDWQLAFQRTD
jgi:hypothetical protein